MAKDSGAAPGAPSSLVDEAREACRQIERIQKINRQILRYSRTESESLAPQELTQALKHALVLMNPQLKRFGVKLSDVRDVEVPYIMGNAGKLEQLFVNLLQNAIDALANQGETKIQIRFAQQRGNLVITFRDNGPGVPEQILEKIFKPFFTTKACDQGTGLGLTIVADIVRAHQGTIRLNGKRKRGTEFIIQFPVLPDRTEMSHLDKVGRQTA